MAYSIENTRNKLYNLNFDKIKKGCNELWFGSIDLTNGTNPKEIIIDESEPFHYVQIMFILKECYYNENKWLSFTKKNLIDLIIKDKMVYIENDKMFGQRFYDEFNSQVDFFLNNYCDVVGMV